MASVRVRGGVLPVHGVHGRRIRNLDLVVERGGPSNRFGLLDPNPNGAEEEVAAPVQEEHQVDAEAEVDDAPAPREEEEKHQHALDKVEQVDEAPAPMEEVEAAGLGIRPWARVGGVAAMFLAAARSALFHGDGGFSTRGCICFLLIGSTAMLVARAGLLTAAPIQETFVGSPILVATAEAVGVLATRGVDARVLVLLLGGAAVLTARRDGLHFDAPRHASIAPRLAHMLLVTAAAAGAVGVLRQSNDSWTGLVLALATLFTAHAATATGQELPARRRPGLAAWAVSGGCAFLLLFAVVAAVRTTLRNGLIPQVPVHPFGVAYRDIVADAHMGLVAWARVAARVIAFLAASTAAGHAIRNIFGNVLTFTQLPLDVVSLLLAVFIMLIQLP